MELFKMLAPIAGKMLAGMVERIAGNLQTTKQGGLAAASVIGVLQLFDCNVSLAEQVTLAVIAGVPLALATDPGKALPTLLEVAKKAKDDYANQRTAGDIEHDKSGQV